MENISIDFDAVPDTHSTLNLTQAFICLACNPDPNTSIIRYRTFGDKTKINDNNFIIDLSATVDYCYGIIFPVPVTKLKIELKIINKSKSIEILNFTSQQLEVSQIKFEPPIIMFGKSVNLIVSGEYSSRFLDLNQLLIERNIGHVLFDVLVIADLNRRNQLAFFSKYLVDSSILMKLYFEKGFKPCGYIRIKN